MPEQIQNKMNGVIPSVPVTTLAGIASLSELLPEMPLPTPLPQTLSNKSLLFHPRVADEAKNLLSMRDESLVPQLIMSLSQTSSDHIELKDPSLEQQQQQQPLESQQTPPELLQAILHTNPNVFRGPQYNSPRNWPQQQQIPGNYESSFSPPSYSNSSGSRQTPTPQGSSPAHVGRSMLPGGIPHAQHPRMPVAPQNHADVVPTQSSPFTVPSPSPRASVITEQSRTLTTSQHLMEDAHCLNNVAAQFSMHSPAHALVGNVTPQHHSMTHNMHLASDMHMQPMHHHQQQQQPASMHHQQMFDPLMSSSRQSSHMPLDIDHAMQDNQQFLLDQVNCGVLPEIDLPIGSLDTNHSAMTSQSIFDNISADMMPSQSSAAFQHAAQPIQASQQQQPAVQQQQQQQQNNTYDRIKMSLKEPVIMLNRSLADQALMKKNLCNALQEKRPKQQATESRSSSKQSSLERPARRKRYLEEEDDSEEEEAAAAKPKIRKFEKKLVPVLPKLSVEELMETNTYQRFNTLVETIFENTEEAAALDEMDEDGDVPQELLIAEHQLQALCSEAAKLKSLGAMESVPGEKLVRLLNILEKNIRDGARVSPLADPDDDAEQSRMWMQIAMSRVQQAVDASLVCLHIMTSSNMPKAIYLEDVIDRIILFVKFQLQNTIYPSYDPVYRIDAQSKGGKGDSLSGGRKKRSQAKEVRVDRSLTVVYSKLRELVGLLGELLNIQVLTDTSVLHASTLGVAPFFVENVSELQLSALRLVTNIFTKYEKHRRLLLDDILASIARLPSSKRGLRTYRLSTDADYIQMLTALVLQLIQCVVVLPAEAVSGADKRVDVDILMLSRYDTAQRLALNFLTVFLKKCGSKGSSSGDEVDYRPLFENFVQDLLATVNKPEWPAAELMLSCLGNLLVSHFSNKGSDMPLRVASIDYLGVVAARLRRDAVRSHCKLASIDQIVADIKAEQARDSGYDRVKDRMVEGLDEEGERVVFLQKVLLDYLAVNATKDSALGYARHFYLAQWYKDCALEKQRLASGQQQQGTTSKRAIKRKHRDDDDDDDDDDDAEDDEESKEHKFADSYRVIEDKKRLIVSKIRPCSSGAKPDILQTYIDYDSAVLISQYLASTRPFSQSFDKYLQHILRVLTESAIVIRTKAMKCLTMIVESDPSVLARADMQLGVKHSFLDQSTSVREAAVDLVGKFVLSRPELIDKYYDKLLARILDTGVSVRKRVIKILKDVCLEMPHYARIPEICVKMIRRVNDEEGIRKLVMEVFQSMWFTPVQARDCEALLRKVMNITDVVAACKDMGLEWFEQLLLSLFKPKEDKEDSTRLVLEPPRALLTACAQIVDCLIENVLRLEEQEQPDESGRRRGASQRLVACLTTLHLFAKIRPQLLVGHVITLQPYLSLKCQTQGDYQIISSVAHTLELVVPLMEHPSETFLAQLEEDSVKLILQHDKSVVASCLSCLGSIVNSVTKNYKLIRDCFNQYYSIISSYRSAYERDPANPYLLRHKPVFRRALFTVGLLLRHFDFTDPDVIEGLPRDIKDRVFDSLFYFVQQEGSNDSRQFTLAALGSLCVRHCEFMMLPRLQQLYHHLLTAELAPVHMRIQVLNNIELYLAEEERRMIRQDQEWAKMCKQENLKEMGDVSSGMASTVIQRYLGQILESYLHASVSARHAALKVVQLVLAQGLVHPVTIVPYLICMSTDVEKSVSSSADKQLQDIEKKYPGFVHTKTQVGIQLSYRLQRILQQQQQDGCTLVRGMRLKESEYPSALNGFLYTILRTTKQQRRAIVQSFLKQFDENAKTSLSQMLYLADNLAYFAYQVQDEPLFIVHHIDIIISMSGTNLLQAFKEALLPKPGSQPAEQRLRSGELTSADPLQQQQQQQQLLPAEPSLLAAAAAAAAIEDEDDEEEEDDEAVLQRLPRDTKLLREYITASQGFLLLLTLRQHLKILYGLTDAKISQYSPSESAKVYEKAVSRKSNAQFKPKSTLERLREGKSEDEREPDEEGRRRLVSEYLDFKQLMLKFDPDEADDDDDAAAAEPDSPAKRRAAASEPDRLQEAGGAATAAVQYQVTQAEHSSQQQQRVPKLTIHASHHLTSGDKEQHHRKHRAHKAEKPKKHKKKRKRIVSDSSDSGDDYSDPDYA